MVRSLAEAYPECLFVSNENEDQFKDVENRNKLNIFAFNMRAMVHREFFSSLNEIVSVLKYEHSVNSTVAISFLPLAPKRRCI